MSSRPRIHRLRAPRHPLGLAPAAFVLALLAACGSDPKEELYTGFDLLSRQPDQVVDQPGELAPEKDTLFGRYGMDGWAPETEKSFGKARVAWSKVSKTRLLLPALLPRDRTIAIDVVGPDEAAKEEYTLRVDLNETTLGEVRLTSDLQTFELDAKTPLWNRGENLLELHTARLGTRGKLEYVTVGVAGVRYEEPRGVVYEDERVMLDAGTAVVYCVEKLADGLLIVDGELEGGGNGQLVVTFNGLSPVTGETLPKLEEVTIEATGGRAFARIPVPDPGSDVLKVDLAWLSDDGASLRLDHLVLQETEAPERPPIIFISIDTLAAQHMSLYGYERETTPNLKELAKDAVVFQNCRANAPWTIPSYMSQLTGLFPRAHQTDFNKVEGRNNPTPWEREQLAPSRWTLAEMLRSAGYATAGFVDNKWLALGFGFQQGFDHYDVTASEIDLSDPDGGARHIVPRALEWIDERENAPFFVFFQAFDPHAPYYPSEEFDSEFAEDGLINEELTYPTGIEQLFAYGCVPSHIVGAEYGEQDNWPMAAVPVEPIATDYDEKIVETDAAVGEFLDELKARGIYDDALIIFSADHGESTLGHDFLFNHALLYNDVMHVPFVVKLPKNERGGTVVDTTVQLVDLYPTMLELVAPGIERDYFHGRSLVPLLRGEEARELPVFGEGGLCKQYSVEHKGWKLIVSKPATAAPHTRITHPRLDRKRLEELAPELATGFHANSVITPLLDADEELRRFLFQSLKGPYYELYYLPDDPFEENDLLASGGVNGYAKIFDELLTYIDQGKDMGAHAQSQAKFLNKGVKLTDEQLEDMKKLGYAGDDK